MSEQLQEWIRAKCVSTHILFLKSRVHILLTFVGLRVRFEKITKTRDAEDCYLTNEETQVCVGEAHKHGIRLCAHARARDSVRQTA